MNKLLVKLPVIAMAAGLLCASPTLAQTLPPAAKAPSVTMILPPTLEIAHDDTAILRWTTTNPGGFEGHVAVVKYGATPNALTQTAESPNRVNRGHSDTMFRVRIDGLLPQTTYYYKVTSKEANGKSDGLESDVNQFTTPPRGDRIVNYPQPK